MSDKALDNAMARRDGLAALINNAQQQIDGWKRELARVDAFIEAWHRYAEEPPMPNPDDYDLPEVPPPGSEDEYGFQPKKKRTTGNTPKEQVAEAARELIAERGEPIGRCELYNLLTEGRGLRIEGADPEMVLSTMLWRMKDRVVRLKSGGYWLPEKDYAPGGYFRWADGAGATDPNPPGELVAEYEEPNKDDSQ